MITADDDGRIILSESGDPRVAYAGMNALSPVLMGLTLPLVFFMTLAPMAFQRSGPILVVLLMLLFLVALVVFVVSVFFKGPVTALAAQPGEGVLEIYRAGPFATSQDRIDADDIADLRLATFYDDDGYATRVPQIMLEDGATVELTIAVDETDVRQFREVLGLRAA
jgi:hypothetical protein